MVGRACFLFFARCAQTSSKLMKIANLLAREFCPFCRILIKSGAEGELLIDYVVALLPGRLLQPRNNNAFSIH